MRKISCRLASVLAFVRELLDQSDEGPIGESSDEPPTDLLAGVVALLLLPFHVLANGVLDSTGDENFVWLRDSSPSLLARFTS